MKYGVGLHNCSRSRSGCAKRNRYDDRERGTVRSGSAPSAARTGRTGKRPVFCIMIDGSGNSRQNKRLDILNRTNDGFEIASQDLKLRGPGDFFGIRQSGDFSFRLADVFQDSDLLKTAAYEAGMIMQEEDALDQEPYKKLKKRLLAYQKEFGEKMNLGVHFFVLENGVSVQKKALKKSKIPDFTCVSLLRNTHTMTAAAKKKHVFSRNYRKITVQLHRRKQKCQEHLQTKLLYRKREPL